MGHEAALTRFPRGQPDVGWCLSCQRDVPTPQLISDGSVSAIGGRANSILAVNFIGHRVRMCEGNNIHGGMQ
jgi:hypothetical protein